MRMYWLRNCGKPKRCGPPAWGLGVGLQPLALESNILRNVSKRLGPGQISFGMT
jgi:hypothetical protein